MRRFTALYRRLDATTKTSEKLAALIDYFSQADPVDAACAVAVLSGRRQRRAVTTAELRQWAAARAGIPAWLFEECYAAVGDLAETVAMVLPDRDGMPDREGMVGGPPEPPGLAEVVTDLLPRLAADPAGRRAIVESLWERLDPDERFVWHKLLTGGFRVGVAGSLVARAVAAVAGVDPATMAHRLMGFAEPSGEAFRHLLAPEAAADRMRPYPFFLASPLEGPPESLGACEDWIAEWKWDGMRAELLIRPDRIAIWTRGEELVTEAFPEVVTAAQAAGGDSAGCVLDGELLAVREGGLAGFAALSRRIGRRKVPRKLLAEVPCLFVAYDCLEHDGRDLRREPLERRRRYLADRTAGPFDPFRTGPHAVGHLWHSPPIQTGPGPGGWELLAARRAEARGLGVEGLMLKRRRSPYGVGRTRGDWWKWKVEPLEIDAVLLYAQAGHGRRATLHTDYTLGVWHDGRLVPVAKAYSGLSDAELTEVDRIVRRTTTQKHGPVRVVEPTLVFEVVFEGLARSSRHKSGVALRFPRIRRWRRDKQPVEAGWLADLVGLLATPAAAAPPEPAP
jgi:DNA ligase-1